MRYFIIGFVLLFAALAAIPAIAAFTTTEQVQVTVTEKERIQDASGGAYLVYTALTSSVPADSIAAGVQAPVEVFENTDSFYKRKYNSADLQAQLVSGHTYLVTVYGWRIPLVSSYRNIVRIENEVFN